MLKRFLQCARECHGVLNAGIHTLATGGAMNMRGISSQQNSALPHNLGDAVLHVKPGGPHDATNCDGSGIAGMTSAYLRAREGKSVVVVDKDGVGRGETAYTTAHLSSEIDASYRKIVQLHGEKGAQLAAQSHTAAISEIDP